MHLERGIILPKHIQFAADQAPVFGESPNDEDDWDEEEYDDWGDEEDEDDDPGYDVINHADTDIRDVARAITWTPTWHK